MADEAPVALNLDTENEKLEKPVHTYIPYT